MNIFDQRFHTSGHIEHLSIRNIEIHARSLFLQGLLLINQNKIPRNLLKFKDKINKIHKYNKINDMTSLELSLDYALSIDEIDKYIIGVKSVAQLKEIINIINSNKTENKYVNLQEKNRQLIVPRNWE